MGEPQHHRLGSLSSGMANAEAQLIKTGNFAAVLLMLVVKLVSQETCRAADLPDLLVMERQAQGATFCFSLQGCSMKNVLCLTPCSLVKHRFEISGSNCCIIHDNLTAGLSESDPVRVVEKTLEVPTVGLKKNSCNASTEQSCMQVIDPANHLSVF